MSKKESTLETSTQGLTKNDFQLLEELADSEFTSFLQGIVVLQSLNDQQIDNL